MRIDEIAVDIANNQLEVFDEIPVELPPQEEAAEAGVGATNYRIRGNQEDAEALTLS